MSNNNLRNILVLSSFNCENFLNILSNDQESPKFHPIRVEFGSIIRVLTDDRHNCWKNTIDYLLIWADPSVIFHSFNNLLLKKRKSDFDNFYREYDEFIDMVNNISNNIGEVFVVNWDLIGADAVDTTFSWDDAGKRNLLAQMNLRLSSAIHSSNISILDSSGWTLGQKDYGFIPKLWFMSKTPFSNQVFINACTSIKKSARSLMGEIRKLLILDLDNTLWGGILGDVGIAKLDIGGHSPIGEAFSDFQRRIKLAKERGLMLAIVSKNDENIALDAINNHPEMILREQDFVSWRINWNDKANNILELSNELKIAPKHIVFIDDNSAEQDRIRTAIEDVFVPYWSNDPYSFSFDFEKIGNIFIVRNPGAEDKNRTKMYLEEKHRSLSQVSIPTKEEWIDSLDIKIDILPPNEGNVKRIVQLFNKTNMMNLSTNRITEGECIDLVKKGLELLSFRVKDKFGDSGIVGVLGFYVQNDNLIIRDFIISCRALGKGLEEVMTFVAITESKKRNVKKIIAKYKPTERNTACLEYWKSTKFEFNKEDSIFSSNLKYDTPSIVKTIEIKKNGTIYEE